MLFFKFRYHDYQTICKYILRRHGLALTKITFEKKFYKTMKLYYQLPHLTYDYSNSKFNLFEFDEALQLYKLIYKDLENFQKEFLRKLEFIPKLENLCLQLGSNFERATPMSLERIREVNDSTIDYLADYYAEIVNNDESKTGKSFYNNFVNKLKEVLDEDNSEQYWHQPPASLSDLVVDKFPKTLDKIDAYVIPIDDEYVELTIRDIKSLVLNRNTKYLVCNNCNIESIELNDQLILLEAHSNHMNTIKLNQSLEEAILWDNPLEYIKLNPKLRLLYLSHPNNHNIEIDNSINNESVEIYYSVN